MPMYAENIITAPVSAIELAAIKRDRENIAEMRRELDASLAVLAEREQDVIQRIDAGAFVDGDATVVSRRRQNISWLTIVKRDLGTAAVLRVKNEWPTTFYKELQVG